MENDDKIINHESRIKKLEEDYPQQNLQIVELLKKIEKKLVGGGLDTNEPGLIKELQNVQTDVKSLKDSTSSITEELKIMNKNSKLNIDFERKIEIIEKSVKNLQIAYWVGLGVIIGINMLLQKSGVSLLQILRP